ncbi:MAG TPA: hypothetical protein VN253_17415, partial [Kofleriaceae bacterium]|nr:hypothetical protein [Kofleriaceae bacterium]
MGIVAIVCTKGMTSPAADLSGISAAPYDRGADGLTMGILLVDSKKRGNLRRVRGAALRPAHEPYEDQLAFLARRAFLSVSASRRR